MKRLFVLIIFALLAFKILTQTAEIYSLTTSITTSCCLPLYFTIPNLSGSGPFIGATFTFSTAAGGPTPATCGNIANDPLIPPNGVTFSGSYSLTGWIGGPTFTITPPATITFTRPSGDASYACTSPTATYNLVYIPNAGTYYPSTPIPNTCCMPLSFTIPFISSTITVITPPPSGVTMNFATSSAAAPTLTTCGSNDPGIPINSLQSVDNGYTYSLGSWISGPTFTATSLTTITFYRPIGDTTACTSSSITYNYIYKPTSGAYYPSIAIPNTCCMPISLILPIILVTPSTVTAPSSGVTINFATSNTAAPTTTTCGSNDPSISITSLATTDNGYTYILGNWISGPTFQPTSTTTIIFNRPSGDTTACTSQSITYNLIFIPSAGTYIPIGTIQNTCCMPTSFTLPTITSSTSGITAPSSGVTINFATLAIAAPTTTTCGSNNPLIPVTSLATTDNGHVYSLGGWTSGPTFTPTSTTAITFNRPSTDITACTSSTMTYNLMIALSAGTFAATAMIPSTCCLPTSLVLPSIIVSGLVVTPPSSGVIINFAIGPSAPTTTTCGNDPSVPVTSLNSTNNGVTYTFSGWTSGPTITPVSTTSLTITRPAVDTAICPSTPVTYTINTNNIAATVIIGLSNVAMASTATLAIIGSLPLVASGVVSATGAIGASAGLGASVGSTASAGSTASVGSSASPGLSSLWGAIDVLQYLFYFIYLNTNLPSEFKQFLIYLKIGTIPLPNIPNLWFNSLSESSNIYLPTLDAPQKFKDYDIDALFLKNGLTYLFYIIASTMVILIIIGIEKIYHKKTGSNSLKLIVNLLQWNFLLRYILVNIIQIAFAIFLQFTNFQTDGGILKTSIAISIISLVFLVLFIIWIFLQTHSKLFKEDLSLFNIRYGSLTDEFVTTNNENIPFIVKNQHGLQILRKIIFIFGFVILYNYVLINLISIMIQSLIMISLFWKYLPYQRKSFNPKSIVEEIIFILISLLLILIDQGKITTENGIQITSYVLIALSCICLGYNLVFLIIDEIVGIIGMISMIRNFCKKKKKKNEKLEAKNNFQIMPINENQINDLNDIRNKDNISMNDIKKKKGRRIHASNGTPSASRTNEFTELVGNDLQIEAYPNDNISPIYSPDIQIKRLNNDIIETIQDKYSLSLLSFAFVSKYRRQNDSRKLFK